MTGEKPRAPGRTLPFTLVCALGSALALNLAMPGPGPWRGWWPLLPFCLAPLLAVAARPTPRRSAGAGFLFGLAAWHGQLVWIPHVLGEFGGLPPWLSWPALSLLAAYMALYPALFCLCLSLLHQNAARRPAGSALPAWIALFAPPLLWTGLEALRGVLFTGFPWMDLGYGLFRAPLLLMPADLGGHHLLSFALVLMNALLVFLAGRSSKRDDRAGGAFALFRRVPRPASSAAATALCLLLLLFGYACFRHRATAAEMAAAPKVNAAFAQGDIAQRVKWSAEMRRETAARYLRLSRGLAADAGAPDLVVWPETALPFSPANDELMRPVADFVAEAGGPALLTGAPLYMEAENGATRLLNGALLLGRDARGRAVVEGLYGKRRLVPFGEYVPLKRLLFFLAPLVEHVADFAPGGSSAPLVHPLRDGGELRVGALICYESIFPEAARASVVQGANLLANLTNDAWYGRSAAPVQSLAMTVLRAVENRRGLVRAANTGISGCIDPLGRIHGESALFTEAAGATPLPLVTSATVFSRGGHWFGHGCGLASLGLLVPVFRGKREERREKRTRRA